MVPRKLVQRRGFRCNLSIAFLLIAVFACVIFLYSVLLVYTSVDGSSSHSSSSTPLHQIVPREHYTTPFDHCEKDFQRLTKQYNHNLTVEDFKRSRAWVGNEQRLSKFASKLSAKDKPVSVVVYGGSISLGHGLQDLQFRYMDQFEKWLNENFPLAASEQHRVFNRAGHGADMCYVAKRLMMMVDDIVKDQEIDLFILEFAVNDYQGQDHKVHLDHKTDVFFDGFQRLALCAEAVVSKLLSTFPNAAILFLEFQTAILNRKTAQVLHMGVAQHYQIPVISYSEALFPGFYSLIKMLEPHGYYTTPNDSVLPFPHGCAPCLDQYILNSFRDKGCKSLCTFMKRSGRDCSDSPPPGRVPCYLPFFAHDAVHPSMIGHQIANELLIHAIADTMQSVCKGQIPQDHILPPTNFLGSTKQLKAMSDFVSVRDTMGIYSQENPLISSNHSEGFKLYGDGMADRKGWIAINEKGGEYVVFDINLEKGCYEIVLSMLKSYEGMGMATIELTDSTSKQIVNSVTADGIWDPRISIPADVSVTDNTSGAHCSGKCQVTVKTHALVQGRKGNKVKIVSMGVQRCMVL